MLRLQKKVPPAKKPHLAPDTYPATVISVEPAPGYAEGHAVKVGYKLTGSDGNCYDYHEIFRTVEPFGERAKKFFDYLEQNGITEWEDFVGCQEVLTLQYEFVGKGKYLNVTARQFVYEDEDGDSDAAAG